jgi:uncharacterized short protein YbdD (DUF466 family)
VSSSLLDPVPRAAPDDAAPRTRLRELAQAARSACRQVFGIPDYERYASHMALRHPQCPVLSRREFFAQAIDRRYGRNGPRCC